MSAILRLQDHDRIAFGLSRDIYRHPEDPRLLIKVMRPERLAERARKAKWYRRAKTDQVNRREAREYGRLARRPGGAPDYIQTVHGFVETDRGRGLVVEAVFGADGGYALSLRKILVSGAWDAATGAAVDAFIARAVDGPAVLRDLHGGNILAGQDANGTPRFVIIDGFGDLGTIPLRALFADINRRRNAEHMQKLRKDIAKHLALQAERAKAGQPSPSSRPTTLAV